MDANLLVLIGLALSTGLLTALFQADKPQQDNRRDDDTIVQTIVYTWHPGGRCAGRKMCRACEFPGL